MELIKGTPYFTKAQEQVKIYPYLNMNISCDVLIVGGGIIGAIANFYLSKHFDTCLIDKGRFGFGCSACSTALLEYTLDDDAKTLMKNLPYKDVASLYKLGQQGLKNLKEFINENGNHCHYSVRDVLIYSNKNKDVSAIETEFEFLTKNKFNCQLLNENQNIFPFEISRGLLFEKSGADVNPYLLIKQLIESSKNQNQIYENTSIEKFERWEDGYLIHTNYSNTIKCKHLVLATGFNFDLFSNIPLCDTFLTYSIVTNPLPKLKWKNNALIQDVLDPYHYLRILPDARIIFGGEDKSFKFGKVIKDKQANKKYQKLLSYLKELFPKFKDDLKIDYSFCGAFGSTRNNLGYIGEFEKNLYLFLSMGANGIVNAFYAVHQLINEIKNQPTDSVYSHFSPTRITKKPRNTLK